MDPAKGTRLDSWKAIADYLGRNTRTVTRWAGDRAMPVHRVPGGKRNAVFAYTAEIDAWMISQSNPARTIPPTNGPVPGTQPPKHFPETSAKAWFGTRERMGLHFRVANKWALVAAILAVIATIWAADAWIGRSGASAYVRAAAPVKLTDDGHSKRNLMTDGDALYFNEVEGFREVLMTTTTHGGPIRQISTPFSNVNLRDVSRDGRNLLISSFEGLEDEQPLWIIPTLGGNPERVGAALCHAARWSSDNSEIACATRTSIVIFDAEGKNSHAVATLPSPVTSLVWSPDDTRIRFALPEVSSEVQVPWELNVRADRNSPAAIPHRISLSNDCCREWGWTRDGKSFVYSPIQRMDRPDVVLRVTDDGSSGAPAGIELPMRIGSIGAIAPGKSEHEIYALIGSTWRGELLKLDPKDNSLKTFLRGISAFYLSFSRDGQWISYVNSEDGSLWRSHADGTDARRLTPTSFDVELPAWSPDGKWLAFTARKPGKFWRIYLVGRDGDSLHEASSEDENQGAPTWSPDGRSIVYANSMCRHMQQCGVHRIDLNSSKVELVPGSNGLRTARWSQDGHYIAALQPETHELMLYEFSTQHWKTLAPSVTGDDISWSADSRFVYVDNPQNQHPIIERIRIKDGARTTVRDLSSLQSMIGTQSMWFGLTPDDSLILLHFVNATEVYALDQASH